MDDKSTSYDSDFCSELVLSYFHFYKKGQQQKKKAFQSCLKIVYMILYILRIAFFIIIT